MSTVKWKWLKFDMRPWGNAQNSVLELNRKFSATDFFTSSLPLQCCWPAYAFVKAVLLLQPSNRVNSPLLLIPLLANDYFGGEVSVYVFLGVLLAYTLCSTIWRTSWEFCQHEGKQDLISNLLSVKPLLRIAYSYANKATTP